MKRKWQDKVIGITCGMALWASYMLATMPAQVPAQLSYGDDLRDFIGDQIAADRSLTWAKVAQDVWHLVNDWTTPTLQQKWDGIGKVLDGVSSGSGSVRLIKPYFGAGEKAQLALVWNVYIAQYEAYMDANKAAGSANFADDWD